MLRLLFSYFRFKACFIVCELEQGPFRSKIGLLLFAFLFNKSWFWLFNEVMNGITNAHIFVWRAIPACHTKMCASVIPRTRPPYKNVRVGYSIHYFIKRPKSTFCSGRMPRLNWVFTGRMLFCWFCHAAALIFLFQIQSMLHRLWVRTRTFSVQNWTFTFCVSV